METWPPERRAKLNAHIARLLGWTEVRVLSTNAVFGLPPGYNSKYRIACMTPKWADGVMETWDLLRDYLKEAQFSFMVDYAGEDAAIQVCLEWARWKGEEFRD